MKWTIDEFLNRKFIVRCNSKTELNEFMQLLLKYNVTWNSGRKATDFYPMENFPIYIYYKTPDSTGLTYSINPKVEHRVKRWTQCQEYKNTTIPTAKYKVEIECDGTTTTAKLIVDGKEVKSATAKKHPDDKFNLKLGMETAVGRLWEKQESKTDSKPSECTKKSYQVGDRVIYVKPEPHFKKLAGMHGKIVKVGNCGFYDYGVEFDENIRRISDYSNDCGGNAHPNHGLYVWHEAIIPET